MADVKSMSVPEVAAAALEALPVVYRMATLEAMASKADDDTERFDKCGQLQQLMRDLWPNQLSDDQLPNVTY
jgi:hypothetical protein